MKDNKYFKWDIKGKRHQSIEIQRINQELLERIDRLFSNSIILLSAVIALWSLTANLLASFLQNYNAEEKTILIVGLLAVVLFGIPTLILFPFSVKLHDNIRAVSSLTAYIKVFVELPSLMDKEDREEGNIYLWETVHCDSAMPKARFFSIEYVVIAIIAPFLSLMCGVLVVVLMNYLEEKIIWKCIFIAVTSLYCFLLVVLAVKVIKNSKTQQHAQLYAKQYLNEYLQRAVMMGVIEKDDVEAFDCFQSYLIERDGILQKNLRSGRQGTGECKSS